MTLNEYRHTDYSLAPVRNPLDEVRWWRYLGGRAYVNPLHDLLYALSRNTSSAEKRRDPGRRQVTFGDSSISIVEVDGAESSYLYQNLGQIKLDYTCFYDSGDPMVGGSYFLRVSFVSWNQGYTIDLAAHRGQCKRLLQDLYAQRVRFQEYYMGSRSFLLNADIPYKRIQELKAEYGLKW